MLAYIPVSPSIMSKAIFFLFIRRKAMDRVLVTVTRNGNYAKKRYSSIVAKESK